MRCETRAIRAISMWAGPLLLLAGAGSSPADPPTAAQPSTRSARPMAVADGDDDLRKLQIDRYNAVLTEIRERDKDRPGPLGRPTADEVRRLTVAWSAIDPTAEVPLREELVEVLRREERFYETAVKDGTARRWTLDQWRYARLDAEIDLLVAKRKLKPVGPTDGKK